MVPPVTLPTMQPWCVHTAVNASNVPAVGWVITIFLSARILPPPTGISEVLASTGGAAGAAPELPPELPPVPPPELPPELPPDLPPVLPPVLPPELPPELAQDLS